MNYIRKIALFIGVGATVSMTPFAVQAQTCANSSQTPLTKSRLDQIATNQGIPLSKVGVKFEEFALTTLKPGDPIASNRRLFPSPLRQIKAGIGNVQPDGVVPLVVNLIPFFSFTYPDSVFYESKAVQRTLLPPSYERYQILGFLDVLDRSSATANNENPANESTFVFQLRGHPWSLIYKPHMSSIRIYLTEEDASNLSESLSTSVIYYAGSDTCATIEYHLYGNGILQEKLSFEEELKCEFQSQLRQLEARSIEDTYTFTMNLIREQDAYIPCLVEVEELLAGQHTTLRIEDLMLNEVERMDYLGQQ